MTKNSIKIELLPAKTAAQTDESTELLVLIRITPPFVKPDKARPNLNLGLVLDRSGSMGGEKLEAVKRAASFAVRQMQPTDRVSVSVYDNEVETIVPSTLVTDAAAIERRIGAIRCGGATALHDGWLAGATEVAAHLRDDQLNRVLLLTDGLANNGETNASRICQNVKGLAARGVSTTALGVGDDFNEDLLQSMAQSGDGNYYFIEGAADLERIFAAELSGLMATLGRKVSLGLETQNGARIADVLSDLEKNTLGRLMLPNLVAGRALEVVVKLQIPALKRASDVCLVRLAFDDPQSGERRVAREALSLGAVSAREWEAMPDDVAAVDAAARLELARAREEIGRHLDKGDLASAHSTLRRARTTSETLAMDAMRLEESASFDAIEREIEDGNTSRASKRSKYDAYERRHSR